MQGREACQKRIFDKLSNETRFTGLSFEKAAARCIARRARLRRTLRTFASRAVFSPTYTPPEKMISIFFALASANSARLFAQTEETLTISFAFGREAFMLRQAFTARTKAAGSAALK